MDLTIIPHKLSGDVSIPSSKSIAHRCLICAALADGVSKIKNISMSQDIYATINALESLGAKFDIDKSSITVTGISNASRTADIDCGESGSTLRFIIPVACAIGTQSVFSGHGRLPERPIDIYIRELSSKGITFSYNNTMPFTVSGTLSGGNFCVEGNVSSQFITGLMLALPLCSQDSHICLTSPLQSEPYVNITIECLRYFGITIEKTERGYFIKGNQKYSPAEYTVEADFSQAAFFIVANSIGNKINITNLPNYACSAQGDKKIIEIAEHLCYNKKAGIKDDLYINASDIPDLVPILSVLCSLSECRTHITNAERLKIKESDRLETTARMLSNLGGNVVKTENGLIISPICSFSGGTVDSYNDHRIAMAAAIAATASTETVYIKNFDAIKKSYPDFLPDYKKLGGAVCNGITLE